MLQATNKVAGHAIGATKLSTRLGKVARTSGRTRHAVLNSQAFMAAQIQRRHYQQALNAAKEMSLAFWNGGKELYAHFMESRKLQAKQASGEVLTRAEQRFIRKTSEDVWKLGPLVLINLLPASIVFLGIYVAAVPGALPSTIRIASWVQKSKDGAAKAKQDGSSGIIQHVSALTNSTPETNEYDHVLTQDIRQLISSLGARVAQKDYISPSDLIPLNKPFETVMDVVEMERPLLTSASQMVGLTTFKIMPMPLKIGRLVKHYAYLASDDKMVLELPGGLNSLSDKELTEFLDERGFHADGVHREKQLQWAHDWLSLAQDPSVIPSVFILFAASNLNANIPNHSTPIHISVDSPSTSQSTPPQQ